MKGILGIKVGMTQVFNEAGEVTPVTIIQAGPCYVTQIKTVENDGYKAVQLGFREAKTTSLTRGQLGHLGLLKGTAKHPTRKNSIGVSPLRHLQEFRSIDTEQLSVGQVLTVGQFTIGEKIDVTGITKGRGFAGVVKRHGFSGGPKTHGQSDRWRTPGSIGAGSTMSRVVKGMRMAGHYGNSQYTQQNLTVVRVDPERHLIAVKGAIPGVKGGLVILKSATKGQK